MLGAFSDETSCGFDVFLSSSNRHADDSDNDSRYDSDDQLIVLSSMNGPSLPDISLEMASAYDPQTGTTESSTGKVLN